MRGKPDLRHFSKWYFFNAFLALASAAGLKTIDEVTDEIVDKNVYENLKAEKLISPESFLQDQTSLAEEGKYYFFLKVSKKC